MDICQNVIPTDNSTLFICSGMQELKPRFSNPDGSVHSSLQSCIRTNDLEEIGDGTHLSSFEMIGNFSFGGVEYRESCKMWLEIVLELGIVPDYITHHPSCPRHKEIWEALGQTVLESLDCEWSDGNIGGYCTEMFKDGVEIGNLVNTSGSMTDVGFGLERLLMLVEDKKRVDETSVFDHNLNPIVRDHVRTLDLLWKNDVGLGARGKEYITRLLVRKCLSFYLLERFRDYEFFSYFEGEETKRENAFNSAKGSVRKHRNKDYAWWKQAFGLMPYEVDHLKSEIDLTGYKNYLPNSNEDV